MSDLGQLLRKARLEKNISIEELEETTKIRKRYLEAIEEGNYKVLPGNFYVRAFIKSYSEAVGLEPDEVLRLYQHAIPPTVPEEHTEPLRRRRRRRGGSAEKLGKLTSSVLMWSFVLLIIVLIYYFVYQSNDHNGADVGNSLAINQAGTHLDVQSNAPSPTSTPALNTTTPAPTPSQPEFAPPQLVKVENSGKEERYTLSDDSDPDHIKLEMEITGEKCWVGVYKVTDGKRTSLFADNLVQGDIKSWVLDGSVYINVGRENAVQLKVNGIPFVYGDTPNPRKIQIDLANEAGQAMP